MAEGEALPKKDRPYWLPMLVATIVFLFLLSIYFTPSLLDRSIFGFDFDTWMNIGYLIIIIMLILQIVWKFTLSTEVVEDVVVEEEEEERAAKEVERRPVKKGAPTTVKPKRVVVKREEAPEEEELVEELPEGLQRPHGDLIEEEEELEDLPRIIEYPKKEPGGVYSDTLIRVDTGLILNLRTLLGKVCHNCEELDDCKRRVSGKLDDEVFLYNFECKDGLKRELHRARKKREAEESPEVTKVKEKAAAAKRASSTKKGKKKAPPRGTSKKKASKMK